MGWKEVDTFTAHPYELYSLPTLYLERIEPSDEQAARIEDLRSRIADIEESEPTSEELEQLHEELEGIEQSFLHFPA